jgi:hypothetical protein
MRVPDANPDGRYHPRAAQRIIVSRPMATRLADSVSRKHRHFLSDAIAYAFLCVSVQSPLRNLRFSLDAGVTSNWVTVLLGDWLVRAAQVRTSIGIFCFRLAPFSRYKTWPECVHLAQQDQIKSNS